MTTNDSTTTNTPENPLIQKRPVDTFAHISEALAALKDHLSKHGDSEGERSGKPSPDKTYNDWLSDMPQFPDCVDTSQGPPPFQNPIIGEQKEDTYEAVCNGVKFLEEIALPWPGNESFSLGDTATWGYVHYLQCLAGALIFESKHRARTAPENSETTESQIPDTPQNTATDSDAESVTGVLTNVYDELCQLLAISEFTQGAVEKLMVPEDSDYSRNLVIGLGQVYSWMQRRGKCLKLLLKQAMDLSVVPSTLDVKKGGPA